MKRCAKCKKKSDDFSSHSSYCRPCWRKGVLEWRLKHPERYLQHRLTTRLRYYNLDLTTYQSAVAKQKGKCKICLHPMRKEHIDHNHATKQFRGLLCASCNTYLGRIEDNPHILKRAIAYLAGRLE